MHGTIPASLARQATLLDKRDDSIPDGIFDLVDVERRNWSRQNRELRKSGVPTMMPTQGFRSLVGSAEPPLVNQTAVTGGTTITALWDAPNLTYFAARQVQADQVFKVTAWGIVTTAVTGGQTATFTPVWGTTTGGTSLGASIAAPLEAKVFTTTNWIAEMYVHIRSAGATGTATCSGKITCLPFVGVAAGTAEGCSVTFGTGSATPTTIDTTVASGLLLCVTPSLATQNWQGIGVVMESLN